MPSAPRSDNPGDGQRPRCGEREREREGGGGGLGLGLALLGVAIVAGAVYLFGGKEDESETNAKPSQLENAEQIPYYHLPPRRSTSWWSTADTTTTTTRSNDSRPAASAATETEGGRPCVCCQDRPQAFMFARCGHICLCEPCLVRLGREYEDTVLRGTFDGPAKIPCPMCRQVGFVQRTYAA